MSALSQLCDYLKLLHSPDGRLLHLVELGVLLLYRSVRQVDVALASVHNVVEVLLIHRESNVTVVEHHQEWLGARDVNVAADVEFALLKQHGFVDLALHDRVLHEASARSRRLLLAVLLAVRILGLLEVFFKFLYIVHHSNAAAAVGVRGLVDPESLVFDAQEVRLFLGDFFFVCV